jgi:hypothetical protein
VAKTNRQLVREAIDLRPRTELLAWALALGSWVLPFTVVCAPLFGLLWWARRGSDRVPQGAVVCAMLGVGSCAWFVAFYVIRAGH